MTIREQLNQHKRRREETEPPKRKANNSMSDQENENLEKLTELRRRYPNRLHLRAPTHAVRTNLRQPSRRLRPRASQTLTPASPR